MPACFVVFQFLAAWLIQRGFSRKTMTVIFSFVTPLCWLLIASIPLLGGLLAFTALFFFGCLFGLAAAVMNLPQPDCPLPGRRDRGLFLEHVRQTLANRPFRRLALVHMVVALGSIAGPFSAAYCLRDVGLSYFGLGLLNAITTVAVLLASPLCGRVVDRMGCRPVMLLGLLAMASLSAFIFWRQRPQIPIAEEQDDISPPRRELLGCWG